MPTNIQLSGFKEFRYKLSNLPKVLKEEVSGELYDATLNWEQRAKEDAPVDQGRLKNEIKASMISELEAQVVCNVEYAAYVEWGTKTKVSVPASIADYAIQFKGNGSSGERFAAQKMIFAWMDRVGVPLEFQWIVYIQIIVKGINPHPFFFIQRQAVENKFRNNLRKIIETEH